MKIGLFDSGIGGLSVLNALLAVEPSLSALYVADTAWMPYGEKSPVLLKSRIQSVVDWLSPQVDCLVVACNTGAALMERDWQTITNLPVYSPIQATALSLTPSLQRIGVMATPTTVAKQAYLSAINALHPSVSVTQVACPGLADAVESNNYSAIKAIMPKWIESLGQLDALVLGCTHYPFALRLIQSLLAKDVIIIDPAKAMAQMVPLMFSEQIPGVTLFTTGSAKMFKEQIQALPVSPVIQAAPVYELILEATTAKQLQEIRH